MKRKNLTLFISLLVILMQLAFPLAAFATGTDETNLGGRTGQQDDITDRGKYGDFVDNGVYVPTEVTPEVMTAFMTDSTNGSLSGSKKQQQQFAAIAKKHKVDTGGRDLGVSTSVQGITLPSKVSEEGYKQLQVYVASAARKQASKSRVDTMGVNFNIAADTDQAAVALAGFLPLVRILVGILLYVITIGMTVFSAFDLIYITSPVFREKSEGMAQSGNAVVSKQTSDGGSKFRWVTDEAMYAVKVCNVENGKSAIFMYLKKRVVAYIALGVVIYVLFTGSVDVLVQLAINMVAGVMEALGNLGI